MVVIQVFFTLYNIDIMLKYVNTDVVFQEIPDEVTLAVNISNCPCRCPGCHSKFLWADTGIELNETELDIFINEYSDDISCIAFMGGDAEPAEVNRLAMYLRANYPEIKTGWYTGRTIISSEIEHKNFDYIKVGPYIAHLGPLKNKKTNQRMYRIDREILKLVDITDRFWRK